MREVAVSRAFALSRVWLGALCALAFIAAVAAGSARSAWAAPGSSLMSRTVSGFRPLSVTFVSPGTGWVLGRAPCAGGPSCLALRETTDGGRSWIARPLPASLIAAAGRSLAGVVDPIAQLNVRFGDPRDGWIYGGIVVKLAQGDSVEPALWSTHDGGLRWRREHLAGIAGSVYDVEAADGTVHLLAQNTRFGATVESSPLTEDNWRVSTSVSLNDPAGGAEPSGAVVLHASSGWLVEGNDRGTSGSARLGRNGRWLSWRPPCAAVGGSFAVPAASTASDLVAVCVIGGFASPLTKSAPRGATLGSSWLYLSKDGGKTFRAGPELERRPDFAIGVLASPRPGVILLGTSGPHAAELRASFDAGLRFTVVYQGQVTFLGFTTPTQGVAIVQPPGESTSMIMTLDGGHHWRRVGF